MNTEILSFIIAPGGENQNSSTMQHGNTDVESMDSHRVWVSDVIESRYAPGVDHPLLRSLLFFGAVPLVLLVWYFASRVEYVSLFFIVSLMGVMAWLVIGPYLVWRYDRRLLPRFFEEGTEVIQDEERLRDMAEHYERLFAKYHWIPSLLWSLPVPFFMLSGRPFLRSQGIFGLTDPFFWILLSVLVWAGVLSGIGFLGVYVTVSAIRAVARLGLTVIPMHPDGLGGLSFVGRYAVRTTLMFATGSLLLPLVFQYTSSTQSRGTIILLYAGVLVYSAAILLSFVYPTIKFSREANERRQRDVNSLLQTCDSLRNASQDFDSDESVSEEELLIELRILRIRSEIAEYERATLYPMNINILSRLLGSVLLPLIFLVIEILIRPKIVDALV